MSFSFFRLDGELPAPMLMMSAGEAEQIADALQRGAQELRQAAARLRKRGGAVFKLPHNDALPHPMRSALALVALARDCFTYAETSQTPQDVEERRDRVAAVRRQLPRAPGETIRVIVEAPDPDAALLAMHSGERRRRIRRLLAMGFSAQAVAKAMGIDLDEVSLETAGVAQ